MIRVASAFFFFFIIYLFIFFPVCTPIVRTAVFVAVSWFYNSVRLPNPRTEKTTTTAVVGE